MTSFLRVHKSYDSILISHNINQILLVANQDPQNLTDGLTKRVPPLSQSIEFGFTLSHPTLHESQSQEFIRIAGVIPEDIV